MEGLERGSQNGWHLLSVDETLAASTTDLNEGLTSAEADARRAEHGPNTITQRKGSGRLKRIFDQFNQPLVIILIIAGVITAALRQWVDSGVIFGVVVVNAIIGYIQEAKAVKAIDALSRSMTTEAVVLRDGQRVSLSAVELVPGDVVLLQAGDKVPADMRLVEVNDCRVDESTLTGESVPVEKQVEALPADTVLADRTNMAYATTLVATGQALGVVTGTGDSTEVGRISHLIAEAEQLQTPLTRKIAKFSGMLLWVIMGLAVITAIVGLVRGEGVVDMLVAAVALAVGAIPEGLPAAVTITLAIGVTRMANRKAIIRKLPAVETLGSTTVICSDKTGTLTENQMTVQRLIAAGASYSVSGTGYRPVGEIRLLPEGSAPSADSEADNGHGGSAATDTAGDSSGYGAGDLNTVTRELLRAGLLCNDSSVYLEEGEWRISGDPTEAALIVSAGKAGLELDATNRHYPRVDTLPFGSEHQYMATLHSLSRAHECESAIPTDSVSRPHAQRVYAKGAVEKILERCSCQMQADGSHGPVETEWILEQASSLASQGLRVLGLASKDLSTPIDDITHEHVASDLVFLGLQGMIDPPRDEALQAIKACHRAGIEVKMITGDHALTAVAIAKALDLHCHPGSPGANDGAEPKALAGSQLAAIPDADLVAAARETSVFARVTPEEKLRLVNALQKDGNIVAMTGDGVNDAPALRQADIGVAMGITGTEVAKEAADMVLADDNFASIEAAVEEGRGVFDNITKFITWTLPTNLGEGLVILAAIFAGVALPILPVQILWINMTTAVLLGLMLAFEPKEEDIMDRLPRSPKTPLLSKVVVGHIVIVGAMLLAGSFGLFEWARESGRTLEEARTIATNVFVFGQIFYLFNCRSLTVPSWRIPPFSNHFLLGGVGLMLALQMLYTYLPVMNSLFRTAPIVLKDWGWIILIAIGVHVVIEIEKAIRRGYGAYRERRE